VHAAGRDGDEPVLVLVQVGASAADVGGALAGLADLGDGEDDDRLVLLGEVRDGADRLPEVSFLLEQRRDREPDRRQGNDRAGKPAEGGGADGEGAAAGHRLALEVARGLGLLQAAVRPLLAFF
jgi:hypothetical protein